MKTFEQFINESYSKSKEKIFLEIMKFDSLHIEFDFISRSYYIKYIDDDNRKIMSYKKSEDGLLSIAPLQYEFLNNEKMSNEYIKMMLSYYLKQDIFFCFSNQ